VQLEPPPIEAWRSDADARSWAREHADGWTSNVAHQTDYCPGHAQLSSASATDVDPPRPTSTARDPRGDPLDRDEYASDLRARLADNAPPTGSEPPLTAAQASVVACLLDELAGIYRGESLGALAQDLSAHLERQAGGSA